MSAVASSPVEYGGILGFRDRGNQDASVAMSRQRVCRDGLDWVRGCERQLLLFLAQKASRGHAVRPASHPVRSPGPSPWTPSFVSGHREALSPSLRCDADSWAGGILPPAHLPDGSSPREIEARSASAHARHLVVTPNGVVYVNTWRAAAITRTTHLHPASSRSSSRKAKATAGRPQQARHCRRRQGRLRGPGWQRSCNAPRRHRRDMSEGTER